MPSDRNEPWTRATYNGFSGSSMGAPPPVAPVPVAGARPTVSTRNLMIGGVSAAVALGLAFGLWARMPNQRDERLSSRAEAATPASVPVEVVEPVPMALPQNTGRMEVLAPDQVEAARASAPFVARRAPAVAPAVIQGRNVAAIAPQLNERPMPRLRRGAIDCGAPASAAEQTICEDTGLAPPRRMSQAERRGLRDPYAEDRAYRGEPRYQRDDEPLDDEPSDPNN